MDKPTKPTNLMPREFGGIKNNFSASLQASGYEPNVPAIYGGDNLNYQLDATGKELDYCEKICDFINGLPIGKGITVDANNKLVYADYGADVTGKANVSLDNLNAEGEAKFGEKVDKSGDTMTGQLCFDGLNGASGGNVPIRTILDYDTSDATLPSVNHYCNGNIANDNQGIRIARSYIRYSQNGILSFVWGLGNDASGSPVAEKQMNFTVNKNGTATLNVPGDIKSTGQIDLSAHSTTSSSADIIDRIDYDTGSSTLPSGTLYGNMSATYDNQNTRIAYSAVAYTDEGITRINNVVTNASGKYTQTYLGIEQDETTNNRGIFYFPKCMNKPTTVSSAAVNKVSVVVANYLNNDSGYIVYSDGLIKQWGRVTGGQTDNTVVLPKKMTTNNYSVVFTQLHTSVITSTCTVSSMTTDSFIIHLGNGNYDAMWQVVGY